MGQIHGMDRKDEKAGEDALKKPEVGMSTENVFLLQR
jgi:hypothetical protein